MEKKHAVKILLEKRFGENNPEKIPCLLEVNTFTPTEDAENTMGIGVQLIIQDGQNTKKEEYQVNSDKIIFSWGETPIIDEKSINHKI